MADHALTCTRCGRTWPLSWRDQPGWLCRNAVVIDAARRFYGRPCMGVLAESPTRPNDSPVVRSAP